MPEPKVVAPASYLFGLLALTADFLEGLPIILGVAMTFILYLERPAIGNAISKTKVNLNLGKKTTANSPAVQKTGAALNQKVG